MKTFIPTIFIYWIIMINGFSQSTVLTDNENSFISGKLEFFQLADIYADSIWTGYNLSKIPIIFHDVSRETGILFNYPDNSLPSGYEFLNEYPGVALKKHSAIYNKGYQIGVEIGNQKGATFEMGNDLTTIAHECFHFYQSTRDFYSNFFMGSSSPSARELTLIQIEQKFLSQALIQTDPDSVIKNLNEFMNIREYRYSDQNEGYIGRENRQEVNEGTAKYVESKFDDIISRHLDIVDSSDLELHNSLEIEIKEIHKSLQQNITISDYKLGIRYYYTGSALCFILDKLSIDDWKERIEDGEILSQIIIELIDFNGLDTAIIDQIEKSFEYKDIHATYTKIIQEEQQRDNALIADFNIRKDYKVTLCFNEDVTDKQVMGSIEKILRIDQDKVLFVDSRITFKSDFAEFEMNGNIMLETIDGNQHYKFYWSSPTLLLIGEGDYTANSNFEFSGGINFSDVNGYIKSDHCEIIRKEKSIKIVIHDKYND